MEEIDKKIKVVYTITGEDGQEMELPQEPLKLDGGTLNGHQRQSTSDPEMINQHELMVIHREMSEAHARFTGWMVMNGTHTDPLASALVSQRILEVEATLMRIRSILFPSDRSPDA